MTPIQEVIQVFWAILGGGEKYISDDFTATLSLPQKFPPTRQPDCQKFESLSGNLQ